MGCSDTAKPFEKSGTGLIKVVNQKLAKAVRSEPISFPRRIMATVVDDDRAESAKTDVSLLPNLSLPIPPDRGDLLFRPR